MTQPPLTAKAPCIVDVGTVIHKPDIYRLLADLSYVQYVDIEDGKVRAEGEGYVMEVFANARAATLVASQKLYINLSSFDYLRLDTASEGQAVFDLVRDDRVLRLLPLPKTASEPTATAGDVKALEAAVANALAAKWDVELLTAEMNGESEEFGQ